MSAQTQIMVPATNLQVQHEPLKSEIMAAVERVIDSGWFILGSEVERFESRLADLCGTRYAVGVANGTDALVLALKSIGIGPGDEVITAPNSFLASASGIVLAGATPVFADVGDDMNIDPVAIEAAVSSKTKAIIPVHLTGKPASMDPILEIARANGLAVIEDAAQAVGASYRSKPVGSMGQLGCFSFHPLKNLNACGDGGGIVTDDPDVYEYLLKARNHGLIGRDRCEFWSLNSRLDALQAAILNVKMDHLAEWTARRRHIAARYRESLSHVVTVPLADDDEVAVYHTFVIRADRRDELKDYLESRGIQARIHYPTPIHLLESARQLGLRPGDFPETERQSKQILTLPIYPELSDAQVDWVIESIRAFYA